MTSSRLTCTVRGCGEPLVPEGSTLSCPRGHAFDRARAGYWSLLQPQDRRSPISGDRPEAVEARRRWIERGFVAGLARALREMVDSVELEPGSCALDVGCGEGTLTRDLLSGRDLDVVGVDLSTRALRLAARRFPRATWVAANADRGLPTASGSVSAAISLFGRRPAGELRRVVREGGSLLVVVPGADDLLELREAAQGDRVLRDRLPGVLAELEGPFRVVRRASWRERHAHDRHAVEDALAMTYRGERRAERLRLSGAGPIEVTLSAEAVLLS